MNPTSPLQQQFPLSPKKFKKKLIDSIVSILFLDVLVGGMLGGLIIFLAYWAGWINETNTNGNGIWFVFGAIIVVSIVIITAINISLYSWYIKTYIQRYYYSGEENFITIKKGVFTPAEIHVQWQKIQDVYVDQDLFDRMMGLYDVHIASATAASGIQAHIDGVDQASAEGLKNFLLNKVSNANKSNSGTQATMQTATTQNQATAQTPNRAQLVNLPEEISSKIYPLSSEWTTASIIGRIFRSIFTSAFLFIYILLSGKGFQGTNFYFYAFLGWLAITVLIFIISIVNLFLWKKNYTFSFNPENIYYKDGIISISEKHMPYSSIQDVRIQQSIVDRFFGLAKVYIENAAQSQIMVNSRGSTPIFNGILIQGLTIADANKITNILKTTILGKGTSNNGL